MRFPFRSASFRVTPPFKPRRSEAAGGKDGDAARCRFRSCVWGRAVIWIRDQHILSAGRHRRRRLRYIAQARVSSDKVLARHGRIWKYMKKVGDLYDNAQGNSTNHMNLHTAGYHSSARSDGAELFWTRVTPSRRLLALSIVNSGAGFLDWEAANASHQNKWHYLLLDDVCILKMASFCYTSC